MSRRPRISLRRQVLVPLLATGLLLFSAVSWIGTHLYKQMLVDHLSGKARMLATSIQSAAGVVPHASYLQRIVDATAAEEGVAAVLVVSGDPPRVLAGTDRRWMRRLVDQLPDAAIAGQLREAMRLDDSVQFVDKQSGVFQYSIPLHVPSSGGAYETGAVLVKFDAQAAAERVFRSIAVWTLLALTTIVVLWLLAWMLLNRHVLAPLANITAALEQRSSSSGEMVLPNMPPNEIGSLAEALEQTFRRLVQSERRAQLALRELALQKQALDEHAIVSETNAQGKIVYANRKFCEVSGYEYHEILGQDHRILSSGVHPKSFWKEMYSALARHGVWHGEVCNRSKNGELYWLQTTNAAFSDPQGRLLGYVSIRTDITERRRAEQANRKLAARLQAILQHAGHAIISTDNEGIIQIFNPAAEAMLGYSADEVIGQCTPLLFHDPEELHARAQAISNETGTRFPSPHELFSYLFSTPANQMDWTYIRKDGTRIPVLLSLSALTDADGTVQGYMGVASDISEQKRVEQEIRDAKDELERANGQLAAALEHTQRLALAAKQATAAKSEFLANMSHEIRTPMTAILGYTDLLIEQDEATGRPRCDALQTIRRNGLHLLDIINDILDLSKIEAGRMEIERVDVPLWPLLNEVRDLMCVRADQKGIELRIQALTPLPECANTDPVRLRQVLVNLVGNAIKFTEQGRVTVSIRYDDENRRGILRFIIEDTGIGISREQQGRLFHPFSQADTSTTRRFGGTGLGLTISKRLVDLLGGTITVESEMARGSRFTVRLDAGPAVPLDQRHFPADVARPAALEVDHDLPALPLEAAPQIGPSKGTILLAEDGVDNQRLIGLVLRKAGYEVAVAENGRIAIEKIRQGETQGKPFDLILMDMQMPEVDGYSAARRLRDEGCQTPIIALTAHAMTGDREKCLAAGCDEYLSKPIDRSLLLATVQALLQQQEEACSNR